MKIAAYVLAANPDWIQASVASYYDIVDQIIVSFDEASIGWNKKAIYVEETLSLLRKIDHANKMTWAAGHFHADATTPFKNETYQRQVGLDLASENADWVLQIDSDEIVPCQKTLQKSIIEAEKLQYGGVDFPSRWLYCHLKTNTFLERCSRFWRISADYPGPIAVRSRTQLTHARQIDAELFRLDVRTKNSDPRRSPNTPVHQTISPEKAILHYSQIRRPNGLVTKLSNHGDLFRWDHGKVINDNLWCKRHPFLAMLRSPLLRSRNKVPKLRISKILPPSRLVEEELKLCSSNT